MVTTLIQKVRIANMMVDSIGDLVCCLWDDNITVRVDVNTGYMTRHPIREASAIAQVGDRLWIVLDEIIFSVSNDGKYEKIATSYDIKRTIPDKNGRIFVTTHSNRLYHLGLDGALVKTTNTNVKDLAGLDSKITLVSNCDGIHAMNTQSEMKLLVSMGTRTSTCSAVIHIAIDEINGHLYATDFHGNSVYRFDLNFLCESKVALSILPCTSPAKRRRMMDAR